MRGVGELKRVIPLALLLVLILSLPVFAETMDVVQPVSTEAFEQKADEVSTYFLDALNPIFILMVKVMIVIVAISLVMFLVTGTKVFLNAIITVLALGLGLSLLLNVNKITDWLVSVAKWIGS